MSEHLLAELTEKVDNLKAVKFLEDVLIFASEIAPIVKNINHSIEDNIKKMPSASSKLIKVTEATESATTEILNTVDSLLSKLGIFTNELNSSFKTLNDLKEQANLLSEALLSQPHQNNSTHIISLAVNLKNLCAASNLADQSDNSINNVINNHITDFNNDLTNIMMALQVQDITSQQIAAVNHLITSIHKRLAEILASYNTSEFSDMVSSSSSMISKMHRDIAFDPHAINAIISKETRQRDVDSFMQKMADGTLDESDMEDNLDSANIDALFSGSNSEVAFSDVSDSGNETVSQDDINSLFDTGTDADEEIDLDDIDALFAN
ncbi:MAG: protein phosphatase CheZ [Candidatus Kapabacteria bacterium]|nr:protein phosphatase CheZ [Candidatus Kapabacteria bacterium]